MEHKSRKKKADKAKKTYQLNGKYTNKSIRVRDASSGQKDTNKASKKHNQSN